jgi:acyl carrier protein
MSADIGDLIDDRLRARTVSAELRTLSQVIGEEGLERIDLLKINVEKSELDVLLGLAATDWPKIRQLVIEVDRTETLQPITDLLAQHGFDVLVEQDELLKRTELCYVYAIRPSAAGGRLLRDQPPAAHIQPLGEPDDGPLTPTTLRAHLKDRLPPYMIPSAFVLMEKLPLTRNGKIDRQAFPAISHEPAQPAARDFVGPRTGTEKALAAIWSELLDVQHIGINDDFFDLGGQSLVAIKAVSRIRDTFEVEVSLRNLFDQPTVAGLAETIDGLSWMSKAQAPSETGDREEIAL